MPAFAQMIFGGRPPKGRPQPAGTTVSSQPQPAFTPNPLTTTTPPVAQQSGPAEPVTVGAEAVRASGAGPFDPAYRQNLATFAGGDFVRPGGMLAFNPTASDPFAGRMPETLVGAALGRSPAFGQQTGATLSSVNVANPEAQLFVPGGGPRMQTDPRAIRQAIFGKTFRSKDVLPL